MWSQYFVFCYDSFFIWSTHKMLTIKRCIVWHFLLFILWNKSGFSSWLLCSKAQFHALLTTSLASIQRCPVRSSRFRFKRGCDWGGDLFTFCSFFFCAAAFVILLTHDCSSKLSDTHGWGDTLWCQADQHPQDRCHAPYDLFFLKKKNDYAAIKARRIYVYPTTGFPAGSGV